MTDIVKENRYCYRCGKRVGKNALNCWYCNAPTARVIRPPRHCPFCQSHISHKAIKCPHCGEFVDGRAPQNPQNLTLNIDKAVFAPGGMQAIGPQAPPQPGQAQYDPSRTIEGQGYTQLPGQQNSGMYLPAPSAEPPPANSLAPYQGQPGGQGSALAPTGNYPLAQPSFQPPSVPGNSLAKRGEAPLASYSVPASEEKDDRYFICGVCNTEILNSDNYCFYCGQMHTAVTEKKGKRTGGVFGNISKGTSNVYHYLTAIILCGISASADFLLALLPQFSDLEGMIKYASVAIAFLLLVWAFMRNQQILNRIVTVIVLLACIFILSL